MLKEKYFDIKYLSINIFKPGIHLKWFLNFLFLNKESFSSQLILKKVFKSIIKNFLTKAQSIAISQRHLQCYNFFLHCTASHQMRENQRFPNFFFLLHKKKNFLMKIVCQLLSGFWLLTIETLSAYSTLFYHPYRLRKFKVWKLTSFSRLQWLSLA